MASIQLAAAPDGSVLTSPVPTKRKWWSDNAFHRVVRHDMNSAPCAWFFQSAYLHEEASVAEGSLIDKMLKSALSPQPGAASPATCLLVLHEVEKKLLVRKSERIRKSLLKRHSQQHARAALQEITKCALGSKCAAKRQSELVLRLDQ